MLVYRRADGMRNFHRSMAEHISIFSIRNLSVSRTWIVTHAWGGFGRLWVDTLFLSEDLEVVVGWKRGRIT